jgi:fused signal recognition particle receptor
MSDKWSKGFFRTKKSLADRFGEVFKGKIDDDLYGDLIESLVLADVPAAAAEKIIEEAKGYLRRSEKADKEMVKDAVRKAALASLQSAGKAPALSFPAVFLVSGVNGVGKTTSIAKLALHYKKQGKSVMLAAADTFRAAASEQLSIWAERLSVPIVKSVQGQDAAGVVFDALEAGKARSADLILCDTAGRMQNKKNLVAELEKVHRVLDRNRGSYSLYSLLVLDAMSGQNSLSQLRVFSEAAKLSGAILTKTDSSAKGGMLIGIALESDIPVWFVGTGEGAEDLEPFDAEKFVSAIL